MLTAQQVADRLQVHRHSVYRWIRAGKLPATKVEGRWQIRMDDLIEHVEGQECAARASMTISDEPDWPIGNPNDPNDPILRHVRNELVRRAGSPGPIHVHTIERDQSTPLWKVCLE